MTHTEIRPMSVRAWLAFVRPVTLGVAVAPVLASLALVYYENQVLQIPLAIFTMTLAVLMQVISNMQNDYGYTLRKAERVDRKGLPRATANQWIPMSVARKAIFFTMFLALCNTGIMIYFGGWAFLFIGISSIFMAWAYMGGPKPIAYTPWGEITVLIFFGLIAVVGTNYLQTHEITFSSLGLGFAIGSIATAVLLVNNWRDRVHDQRVGRCTLAVCLSDCAVIYLYRFLLLLPYCVIFILVFLQQLPWTSLIVFFTLWKAWKLTVDFTKKQGNDLNDVLKGTVSLEMQFAFIFVLGMLFARYIGV